MKKNKVRMNMVKISSVVRRPSVPFFTGNPFIAALVRGLGWLIVGCVRATLRPHENIKKADYCD
jgi:hypothetical protein